MDDSVTPLDENGPTAITHSFWMKTMESLRHHPSTEPATKQLAEMCAALMEINKHDPQTIDYLNLRAQKALDADNGR